MKLSGFLAVILLVVGLIAGLGIGSQAFPRTVTSISRETEIVTSTLTKLQPTTIIETRRETVIETHPYTVTKISFLTTTETETRTTTATITDWTFITITRRVYPSESEQVLLTASGSGSRDTRPFTLNETSDLRIIVIVKPTGSIEYVTLHWYLIPVGAEEYQYVKDGKLEKESGTIEFYASMIRAGSYYLKILSANCKWSLRIEKARVE